MEDNATRKRVTARWDSRVVERARNAGASLRTGTYEVVFGEYAVQAVLAPRAGSLSPPANAFTAYGRIYTSETTGRCTHHENLPRQIQYCASRFVR